MAAPSKQIVTIHTVVNAPVAKTWETYSNPDHITKWNQASPEWHTPWSKNDLRVGGAFSCRMEAKDGSMGFEFSGIYDAVEPGKYMEYHLEDGRRVTVGFESIGETTKIIQTFEPESSNPVDMQQMGWQAILDSFKNYTEGI
ncbi:MAG: polyketide cyclase [Chitinophagaceae bacterium]|nr:MAG: polyketide cyclase [Chitinophagaceae bacterium]